jgi:hypothetical protein
MRNRFVRPLLVLAVVGVLPSLARAEGQQYYSAWQKHPTANYWYTSYNYKPSADDEDYQHHYVIWTPASPKYCYCYNPSTKTYYGRWDLAACGKQGCHLGKNPHGYYAIAKVSQKGTIADIPETAFTPRSAAPQIPVDSGNPAPPAPAANAPAATGTPAPPAATDPPAAPANPPAATTPETPAPAATTPAPNAQANANPQIQPPPDLPEEAFPGNGNS